MIEELANEDFEKTSNSIKIPDEAEVRNSTYYGLRTSKVNINSIDIIKKLGK